MIGYKVWEGKGKGYINDIIVCFGIIYFNFLEMINIWINDLLFIFNDCWVECIF